MSTEPSGDGITQRLIALRSISISRWVEAIEPIPDADHHAPAETRHPAVRLCLAADIEFYSRFNNVEASRAQGRFIEALRHARIQACLTESEVDIRESGDGQFAVLPPGLDESTVIPELVTGLSTALQQTNADLSAHARLRLRVAMHRGLLKPGVNGWVGNSATAVHRLLDSAPLRVALAQEPAVDFALIVSDTLYRDVIEHGDHRLVPGLFHKTIVDIPAKRFTEQAWIYLPLPR